jgi:neutral ceramidase
MARGVLVIACVVLLAVPAGAQAGTLRAGAGRADITPPTGYYFLGWARSDSQAEGQHTRLFARAIVLERDGRKLVLVAVDVALLGAGMIEHATRTLRARGITQQNTIVSASHTHGAQAGYFNFPGFNTVPPDKDTPAEIAIGPADPQLYGFMVRQLATAIRRADDNLAPAALGWGETTLLGLTQNRSIEAHLANHGIDREFGEGSVALDPDGYAHTIDPEVHVLRVDKLRRRRRMPIGVFMTFANHGTVNRPTFLYYNADHHGAATRVLERELRRAGRVPASTETSTARPPG